MTRAIGSVKQGDCVRSEGEIVFFSRRSGDTHFGSPGVSTELRESYYEIGQAHGHVQGHVEERERGERPLGVGVPVNVPDAS